MDTSPQKIETQTVLAEDTMTEAIGTAQKADSKL